MTSNLLTKWLGVFVLGLFLSTNAHSQVFFSEDFESGNSFTTNAGSAGTSSTEPCSGTSLRSNIWSSNDTFDITAPIGTATGDTLTLSFEYKFVDWASSPPYSATSTSFGPYFFQVGPSATGPWTTVHTQDLTNHTVSTSCANVTVSGINFPAGPAFLRVAGSLGSGDYYIYLDDVSVIEGQGPACFAPINLNTINITTSTATGVWSSDGGPGTEFELELGPAGFTQGTGIVVSASDTFYNATGLMDGTTYDWYVREICAAGDTSLWAGPATFTTPLNPVSNPSACKLNIAIPDNNTPGFLTIPINVSTSVGTQLGTDVILTDVDLIILHTWRADVEARLVSPNGVVIDLVTDEGSLGDDFGDTTGGCTQVFNFNMDALENVSNFGSADPAVGSWIPEDDFALFNDGSDPNGIWELRVTDDANGDFGSVEFIELAFAAPPTCLVPINLNTINITTNSATGVWSSDGGPGTEFEVEFGAAGFVQGTGTIFNVTDTFINATSLMPATSYDWYVREICAAGDTSLWSGVETFTTLCAPFATPFMENFDGLPLVSPYRQLPDCWTPQVGPDFWDVTNDVVNNGHSWLPNIGDHTTGSANYMWIDASSDITANEMITGEIDMTSLTTPYVGLWFASNNTSNATNHTIAIDAWDGSAWVQVVTERGNFSGWVEVADTVPAGIPAITRFRIYAIPDTGTTSSTYFQNDLGVDDFFVREAPNCFAPNSLSTINVTTTSATGVWSSTSGGSNFEVEYGVTGFSIGSGTRVALTDTFVNVSSLSPATTYQWYVREVCGPNPGDTSLWAGPSTFTTLCAPFAAPFTENFDGLPLISPYRDLPNCWTPQVGPDFWDVTNDVVNTGHSWLPNIGDHTTGSANYMWIDASSNITGNEMVSAEIDMSTLTVPFAGFWFASNNTTNTINHTISLDAWDGAAWVNIALKEVISQVG